MSFAGTVQDMINRMKQNEAHRKALQSHRRDLRKSYADTAKFQNTPVKEHDISKEDLELLKAKIREDIVKERKVARLKFVLVAMPVLLIFGCLMYLFFLCNLFSF